MFILTSKIFYWHLKVCSGDVDLYTNSTQFSETRKCQKKFDLSFNYFHNLVTSECELLLSDTPGSPKHVPWLCPKTCPMGLRDFLNCSNALNIPLSRNLVAQCHRNHFPRVILLTWSCALNLWRTLSKINQTEDYILLNWTYLIFDWFLIQV